MDAKPAFCFYLMSYTIIPISYNFAINAKIIIRPSQIQSHYLPLNNSYKTNKNRIYKPLQFTFCDQDEIKNEVQKSQFGFKLSSFLSYNDINLY